MTANQKAQARIFFENRILKADNQAFEDLFRDIMRYKEPDFRSIKPWGNIGDRKNDGYIPSRGVFYQVYAPEDIRKSYPDVIKKIKTDFAGLVEQWSGVKEFYFVVNDKYKGVNADSEQLLTQIKEDNGLDESKFITASDLENILFSLSDDQIIKITGVSFIDNPILTPAILQNSYLKKFSTISLLTIDTPKPIDEIFVNLAIIKEQNEEVNKDKTINREAFLSSYEEIYKPKEPIEINELVNKSNKSLIYGKAGIGKTTLCKYISYKWAKGELYNEFEYLIYIPLREWKSGGIQGAIRDYYYSHDVKDISIDFDVNKTLFLFDGYDELDGDKKKILRDEIEHYHLSHYIITTRPYGYQKNDFSVNEYFETIGFTDEDVIEYIDNFFGKSSEKGKGLKNFLQSNISIKHIAYIPLMLEMICSLWEQKEFGSDMSMTELYSQVIENMLKKHSANKDDKRVYTRKNRKKIQEQLGKLAFEGLTKQTILFDGDFIEDSIDDIEFFEKHTIYSGFLKSDAKEKDLLDNSFEFPHLTFQEYFSALYVSKLEPKEQSKIIRDWKFYPHMQMFFAFLGGLIEDKEFLFNVIESEPKDLFGLYESVLFICCIREVEKEKIPKTITNKIIFWLNFIIKNDLNLENYLNKINSIAYLIDDILDILIKYIKDKDIDHIDMEDIGESFCFLGRNDDEFIKILIKLIKDKNINSHIRKNIAKSLCLLGRNDDNFIDILIELIKDENIDRHILENIAKSFSDLGRSDDKFTKALIELIKDKNIDVYIRTDIVKSLNLIYKNNDEFIESMFQLIQNKNIDNSIKKSILSAFSFLAGRNNNNTFIDILILLIKNEHTVNWIKSNFIRSSTSSNQSDNTFIDILIEFTKDENIDNSFKESIIESLCFLGRNDNEFIDVLIRFIKDKNIDTYIRRDIGASLYLLNRNDDKFVNILIKLIKDKNIELSIRGTIGESLSSLEKNNDKILNILIELINNKHFPLISKEVIVNNLSIWNKKDNKLIQVLIEFIRDKDIDGTIQIGVADSLVNLGRRDNEFINILNELIEDTSILYEIKSNIGQTLFSLGKRDDKIFNVLIKLIENKYFDSEYIKTINILFKMYDRNYKVEKYLYNKILYDSLPFYIKNNRFYTIENGKEISTKREVDENTLNIEIKKIMDKHVSK